MAGGGASFTTVLYAADDSGRAPYENLLALRERLDTVKTDLGPFDAQDAYAVYANGEGEGRQSRLVLIAGPTEYTRTRTRASGQSEADVAVWCFPDPASLMGWEEAADHPAACGAPYVVQLDSHLATERDRELLGVTLGAPVVRVDRRDPGDVLRCLRRALALVS